MPLPGRQSKKKSLFSFLNPGERGGEVGAQEFHDIEQAEHNLRQRSAAETPAAPPAEIVATQQSPQKKDIPKPPVTQQRDWHKKSDWYDTVTPQNKITVDPDADPSAYHTIGAAIANAKVIYPGLTLIYTDPIIEIEVHGGQYKENIVIDVSYLRLRGIGKPVITADPYIISPGVLSAVVLVTKDCTRFWMNEFEIVNGVVGEGLSWQNAVGIIVEEGNDYGGLFPDVEFHAIHGHGGGTQAYFQRRVYCSPTCVFQSEDNYSNPFASEASVICRYGFGNVDSGGSILPQRNWTILDRCRISGEATANVLVKGKALAIWALKSDLGTWVSNTFTGMMATDAPLGGAAGGNFYCRTGVFAHGCHINGWTENKGWAAEFFKCHGIGGTPNIGGASHVHHFMYARTHIVGGDPDVNAYTWFTDGSLKVQYWVEYADAGYSGMGFVAIATSNIWLKDVTRSGHIFALGSEVVGIGPGVPAGVCFASGIKTPCAFIMNGPPEGAALVDCFKNQPIGFFREGYLAILQ